MTKKDRVGKLSSHSQVATSINPVTVVDADGVNFRVVQELKSVGVSLVSYQIGAVFPKCRTISRERRKTRGNEGAEK